jgi:hypothetical protein
MRARASAHHDHLRRAQIVAVRRAVPVRHDLVSEKESSPLACASAQGRRRAARAQSQATLHKVGWSWSTCAPDANMLSGSAGPTTPPRFEPMGHPPWCARAGEPTVSHEGCSGRDSSSIYLIHHSGSRFLGSLFRDTAMRACASGERFVNRASATVRRGASERTRPKGTRSTHATSLAPRSFPGCVSRARPQLRSDGERFRSGLAHAAQHSELRPRATREQRTENGNGERFVATREAGHG